MKKNKLIVYEIAVKWRLIFYLIAALMILIPISKVLVTDNAFSSFYGNLFINTAIIFVIIGRVLTVYKKTIENGAIPWAGVNRSRIPLRQANGDVVSSSSAKYCPKLKNPILYSALQELSAVIL